MLNVQRFITADGWEALTTKLGIKVTAYPDNGVAVLNYTPKSPKTHPVVVECRALILSYPGAEVVARSFDRFFNRNEDGVDEEAFDFRDSWCMCKYDGTLILFYFCTQTDRWEIATRTRAFAEGPFGASNLGETFRLKILQASFPGVYQQNKGEQDVGHVLEQVYQTFAQNCLQRDETVILEYIGPENEIVTRYRYSQLVLLSKRNTKTGVEVLPDRLEPLVETYRSSGLNIALPTMFRVDSEMDINDKLKQLTNKREEGFVVCQPKTMQRLKMKTPVYVFFHQIMTDLEDRHVLPAEKIVKVILSGRYTDFITEYPMYIHQCDPYVNYWEDLKNKVENMWLILQDYHHNDWHRLFFSTYSNSVSKCSNIPTWIYYEALKTKRHPIYVLCQAKNKAQMKFFEPESVSNFYWAYNY